MEALEAVTSYQEEVPHKTTVKVKEAGKDFLAVDVHNNVPPRGIQHL
jgi:hypothetical protein